MRNVLTWATAGAIAATVGLYSTSAQAQWGTIKGKVIAEGNLAPLDPVVKKGDKAAKDSEVCAAEVVPNESKVIDKDTKGVANVVIWVATKPAKIHPKLEKPAKPVVDFDQKGCRFKPHILLVRTDQKVNVLSDDGVAHNTHTWPRANKPDNFIVAPNDRKGVEVKNVNQKEKTPTKVTCDIHSFMEAYWVVLDHPYAAVTNEKGEFEIADLPVGEHEIKVWQEKIGWVVKSQTVKVKDGANEIPTIKAKFE